MSNPVREIQLSLQLDPEQESDRQALAALKQWYQRAKIINSDNDSFDFFKLRLHKNIYLSGLFLCLLEPKLIKCLSRHLQEQQLTGEFLHRALAEHGIMPGSGASMADPLVPDELATSIVDRLTPLLNNQRETASLGEQNAQLQAQVGTLAQRLQEQGDLLQQQARLLDSLARSGGPSPSGTAETPTLVTQGSGELPLHDLSATAARVRKVRAKGVF